MRIRFKQLTKVSAFVSVCPCTGKARHQVWEFDPGEEIVVTSVTYGKARKVKSERDRPGGRLRLARITLPGSTGGCLDYLDDVLETDFEVITK